MNEADMEMTIALAIEQLTFRDQDAAVRVILVFVARAEKRLSMMHEKPLYDAAVALKTIRIQLRLLTPKNSRRVLGYDDARTALEKGLRSTMFGDFQGSKAQMYEAQAVLHLLRALKCPKETASIDLKNAAKEAALTMSHPVPTTESHMKEQQYQLRMLNEKLNTLSIAATSGNRIPHRRRRSPLSA